MTYSKEEIQKKFGGKLIGRKQVKDYICDTLCILPSEMVDYLTRNVWFVSSFDDAWGFTFWGDELKNKHLIFLSDELFSEPRRQVSYTIIHEVGHVILKHRNSILEQQSKHEIEKQEFEADRFARYYLDN